MWWELSEISGKVLGANVSCVLATQSTSLAKPALFSLKSGLLYLHQVHGCDQTLTEGLNTVLLPLCNPWGLA